MQSLRLGTVLTSLLLAGCAALPPHSRTARPLQPANDAMLASGQPGPWPRDEWWKRYHDPQIDQLVAEALSDSPSVAAAAARIRKADALARQASAVLPPGLAADASLTGNQQTRNNGVPPQFVPRGVHANTRVTASATWDPDLWGRNRDALAAARGEALAAQADAAEARRVLTTALVGAYIDLARALADRENAIAVAQLRRRSFDLSRARAAQGLETSATTQQALAIDRGAQSDLVAIDEQIALSRARIAALAGKLPARGSLIGKPVIAPTPGQYVPADAGLDIVSRRPDIAASLLRIDAASRRVTGARKDFLPNISLSGLAGLQSLDIADIAKPGSGTLAFGLALHLPVFDGGRLRSAYLAQQADYDLGVANYNLALTNALQEVAAAVVSGQTLDKRIGQLREAEAAAARAHGVAVARYEQGLTSYLNVLSAEDTLVATRRALLAVQFRRLSADVDLLRALGGGYVTEPRTKAPSP